MPLGGGDDSSDQSKSMRGVFETIKTNGLPVEELGNGGIHLRYFKE